MPTATTTKNPCTWNAGPVPLQQLPQGRRPPQRPPRRPDPDVTKQLCSNTNRSFQPNHNVAVNFAGVPAPDDKVMDAIIADPLSLGHAGVPEHFS